MLPISRRHSHFVFGILQSGLTSFVATGIASLSQGMDDANFRNWMVSWLVAWILMLPVVLLAAPAIRRLADAMTREER